MKRQKLILRKIKKYIHLLYTVTLLFLLVFQSTRGLAQTFNFDSTNCQFLSVSTDTTCKIVKIIMKIKNTPEKGILECKNSTVAYSFSASNVSVDMNDGRGEHPSTHLNVPQMQSQVKRIESLEINLLLFSLKKNQYRIEIGEAVEFDRSTGWLMDQKTSGFKMESLILNK